MEELKQLLLKKSKLIGQLKYPQRNNRQAMIKLLKRIKKEEKELEPLQKNLISSLSYESFTLKQDLQKVYFLSFKVMKSLCKKFEFIPEENELYANIIEMHYKFYVKEEAIQKAQEIKQAYRKKTHEKDAMLKILISWLYEWGKKKLQKLLHKNISAIEKDLLIDKLESPKKASQNVEKTTSPLKEFLLQGSLRNISYSEKLVKKSPQKKPLNLKIILNGANNILSSLQQEILQLRPFQADSKGNIQEIQLDGYLTKQSTQTDRSTRLQTSFQPQSKNCSESPEKNFLKYRSKSYTKDYPSFDKSPSHSISLSNLNKQIFYGTYWKEMNSIYKNMSSCLGDLDMYYLKTFKKQKQDKREQIMNNRIDQIVDLMIKSMPQVKKSIQAYDKEYSKGCPEQVKISNKNNKIAQYQYSNSLEQHFSKQLYSKKSTSIPQYRRQRVNNSQKVKSQEMIYPQQNQFSQILEFSSPQKLFTQPPSATLTRIIDRNKSYQQARMLRKSVQERQVKLPIVYNPQNYYNNAEKQEEKAMAIHQKFEKFLVNSSSRPNKGLARYKLLNKERQKTNGIQKDLNLQDQSQFFSKINKGTEQTLQDSKKSFVDFSMTEIRKQRQYQVANIRRILKKRQKQRQSVNKTPTSDRFKNSKEQNSQIDVQNLMLQIKVIESQRQTDSVKSAKKTQKFDVFLNSFKNTSSPYGLKQSARSFNFGSMKNSETQQKFSFKQSNEDFLPKIS